MLIGYVQNGIALNNNWKPFTRRNKDGTVSPVRIFDAEKKLILGHGERILLERADTYFKVMDDWFPRQSCRDENHFESFMKPGITIVTNRRVLFHRIPDPLLAPAGLGWPNQPGAVLIAREAKKRGMLEFCQVSFNNVVKIKYYHGKSCSFYVFYNYKRYEAISSVFEMKRKGGMLNLPLKNDISHMTSFSLMENILQPKEIEKRPFKYYTDIYYVNPPFFDDKRKHWKRDDLLKKASRYEHWGKYKKALAQYQKILEIFPDDESTRKKVDQLSGAK